MRQTNLRWKRKSEWLRLAGMLLLVLSGWKGRVEAEQIQTLRTSEGPWGRLESYEVILEPLADHLWRELFSDQTVWIFPLQDWSALLQYLRGRGFGDEQIQMVDREARREVRGAKLVVYPPNEVVATMTTAQRTLLYDPMFAGEDQPMPMFSLHEGRFERVAADMPTEMRELVNGLAFPRGRRVVVADVPYLLSQLESGRDRVRMLRALSRAPSLVGRLWVDEESNLDEMLEHWTMGGRNPGAETMLRSVSRVPGGGYLDLIHLLPATARQYLNTFPLIKDLFGGGSPDCFWAAMNFIAAEPSMRPLDSIPVDFYLNRDYERIEPPYRMGDIMVLLRQADDYFIHTYIHIADDIVFTKDGKSTLTPWILAREEEMLSRYGDSETYTVSFRLKER